MPQTSYGDISQRTAAYAAVKMLEHAEPILVLSKFGQQKPLPKNKADTIAFRRPVPFGPALTPLMEGVTPASQMMGYEDVSVKIEQYGALVQITDKIADLCEDPVINDAATLCGEQAGETLETITWGVLKGGTSVFYADGATAREEVNAPISIKKLHAAVRYLMAQRTKRITQILSSSVNFDTHPVEAAYVAFGHTDMEHDIRALPGFLPVAAYGSRKPLCPEELGSVESIRFILSPLLSPWEGEGSEDFADEGMKSIGGTSADVYPLVIIGQNAFGLVPLKGQNAIEPSVIDPSTKTKDDPLGQRGYVSWKTYFAALRLSETCLARIECAVTAL
jgi:N4-gp56 family major capsid protein